MRKVAILIFLLIMLTGCDESKNDLNCFDELQPSTQLVEPMESGLFSLSTTSESDFFRVGEKIEIEIKNDSEISFWFPSDYNILMLQKHPIDDSESYIVNPNLVNDGSVEHILGPSSSKGGKIKLTIQPEIVEFGKLEDVELYISGYRMSEGKICTAKYFATILLDFAGE